MKTSIGSTISNWDFTSEGETVGKNIIEKIKSGIKQDQLVPKGKEVMRSLKKGLTDGFNSTVKPELAQLGNKCVQAVGNLSNTLHSKGQDLMIGFINGVKSMSGAVNSAVQSVISSISIPNTGSMLYGAGQSIVDGLINGMASKASQLASKAQELGNIVKNNKGPIEYDKIMLYPAGQYIIEGLINGMEAKERSLYSKLGQMTHRIASTCFKSPQYAYATSSSSGTSYNIYINGTKINDDPQIRNQFETLIKDMARKGMM